MPRLPLLLSLACAASCSSPQGPPMHEIAVEINSTIRSGADVLVPGDKLLLNFAVYAELGQPDLHQEIPVQHDGTISVMGVGSVMAAGRTPAQLTQLLVEQYEDVLGSQPIMSVAIGEQVPRQVYVLGGVRKSGPVPMPANGRLTLPQAFAAAGGVRWLASYLGNTLIVRWDDESQTQLSWVVDAGTEWWGEAQTIMLQPNDVIYVPDTTVVKVNTWIDHYITRMIPFPRFFVPVQ